MAIDLSKYDGLNASDAEKRAGSANDEFHPLICEYVSGEECQHVSPDERKRAISAAVDAIVQPDPTASVTFPSISVDLTGSSSVAAKFRVGLDLSSESAPKEDPAAVENAKSRGKRGQK